MVKHGRLAAAKKPGQQGLRGSSPAPLPCRNDPAEALVRRKPKCEVAAQSAVPFADPARFCPSGGNPAGRSVCEPLATNGIF